MLPKICDYSIARIMIGDKVSNFAIVTSNYMAPELIPGLLNNNNKNDSKGEYNEKIDLWSIVLILYKIYFKEVLFTDIDLLAIKNKIKNFFELKEIENEPFFENLLRSIIKIDLNKRIGFTEYINHIFWKNKELSLKENKKKRMKFRLNEYNFILIEIMILIHSI